MDVSEDLLAFLADARRQAAGAFIRGEVTLTDALSIARAIDSATAHLARAQD